MLFRLAKTAAVVVGSTILATLATNAVDMHGHFDSTFLGSMLAGWREEASGPCPENMVLVTQALTPFCVDQYEASAGSGCPVSIPGNADETTLNLASQACKAVSAPDVQPWRFISQTASAQACSRAGKRLLTPGEWYKAALGTPDAQNATEDGCNTARNLADGVAPTGQGMRCVSDAGAYDMVGNLWEWTDGVAEQGRWQGRALPPTGFVTQADMDGIAYETATAFSSVFGGDRFWSDASVNAGMLRGGYYDSRENAGTFSVYAANEPSFTGDAVGFRCAVTPVGNI